MTCFYTLYSGDNYENATALVVTFVVNNYKDSAFQHKAQEWEKLFLAWVEAYKERNDSNISIVYSAEVRGVCKGVGCGGVSGRNSS